MAGVSAGAALPVANGRARGSGAVDPEKCGRRRI